MQDIITATDLGTVERERERERELYFTKRIKNKFYIT